MVRFILGDLVLEPDRVGCFADHLGRSQQVAARVKLLAANAR